MKRFAAAFPAAIASVFLSAPSPALAGPSRPADQLSGFQDKCGALEDSLLIVERLYVDRIGGSERDALKKRFSDAELQFLLQNYEQAGVLLYDLMGNKDFLRIPESSEALYMLAESLYQQQSFHGARLYFREYLSKGQRRAAGSHYSEALLRYIDLSARFSDFSGIDKFTSQLKREDGTLPPEVAYAYGKWIFGRQDLPEAERQKQAGAHFGSVVRSGREFVHQALYFLGVLAVQRGDLEAAAESFRQVIAQAPRSPTDRLVQEQAQLALGRIHMEEGRFSEAIDRYQNVDYRSDAFVEALYEIAWAHVRRARASEDGGEDYRKALQAAERLVATAPDSLLAPDAMVLQGHLYLLLEKFDESGTAYQSVIDKFRPAYDGLSQKLGAHPDPVEFFQSAIQSSSKTFDLELFLPRFAIPWATTQREIAEAVRITSDIDATHAAIAESLETAERMLDQLDGDRSSLFPFYQKGFSLADDVDSGLTELQRDLIALETEMIAPRASGPGAQAALAQVEALRKKRTSVEDELKNSPKTQAEYARWRQSLAGRVRALEQDAHRTALEAESLFAIQAAIEKLLRDTKDLSESDRRDFSRQLASERAVAEGMRETIARKKREISEQRVKLDMIRPDDSDLRARYVAALHEEQKALEALRRHADTEGLPLAEVDALKRRLDDLRERTLRSRTLLRERIDREADEARQQILREVAQLDKYQGRSRSNASQTRGLIGSIAFQSFRKVLGRFYDAMIKAEVGLIDIAWTRKQLQTEKIQKLSSQKEGELRDLKQDFSESLDPMK